MDIKFRNKIIIAVLTAILVIVAISLLFIFIPNFKENKTIFNNRPDEVVEVPKQMYGIVADDSRAVEIGMEILRKGGSAVDAAIAVSYAMSVVSPYATGMGGSGIMLVYPGNGSDPVVYDYMGTAPQDLSSMTAVPGFVKGMETAHSEYGKLSMNELIDPSIKLAENGIKVSSLFNKLITISGFKIDSSLKGLFFKNGEALAAGEIIKQPKLAKAFERIKTYGSDDFYKGEIAKEITKNSKLTMNDLGTYEVLKKEAVKGSFYGYDVYSSSPPSGGVTLIQTLSLVEKLNLAENKENSANYVSRLSGITQVTYHDRLGTVSDPLFNSVDTDKLTSEAYISGLATQVITDKDLYKLSIDDKPASDETTTHIVIYDKDGMMVSVTNTLSNFFGTGNSASGFFLNNHIDNFSTFPESLNAPVTGKRPRSFIAPTILAKDGKPVMGIGSPGGMRIPLMIAQVLVRGLVRHESLQTSVDAPRFFYYMDMLYIETNYLSETQKNILRKKGLSVIYYNYPQFYGSVNTLFVDTQNMKITGGADQRRNGYFTWEQIK